MELLMLAVVAVAAVVMYFTFTSMFGKKPDPVDFDIAGSGSPNKKKPKKKAAAKAAPVTEKWDAPEPTEKGKKKAGQKKEAEAFFDPVKQGETIVKSAHRAAAEDKQAATQQQLSQRQRNKLQAQGFVVENKVKPRRTSSRDKVEDKDESGGKYDDLTPEQAERMMLLERIASGQRAVPDDRPMRTDRKPREENKEKEDAKAKFDNEALRKRLLDEKLEKKRVVQERTQVRGGRVAFSGGASMKPLANAWARPGAASPPAAETTEAPEATEAPAPAAPEAEEPEA